MHKIFQIIQNSKINLKLFLYKFLKLKVYENIKLSRIQNFFRQFSTI